METHARLTITTTGPAGEPRTWVFRRSSDGYPEHTMPVLAEFLNRTKREARPPATRDEAERWLNDAERSQGAKTRDDAAQWPDAWWMEATQPHTPNGPITHTPAGDVSHTYHVDLRTRPEDQPATIANPDPLPPREDLLKLTKADLADTALTAEAERNQARNRAAEWRDTAKRLEKELHEERARTRETILTRIREIFEQDENAENAVFEHNNPTPQEDQPCQPAR